MGDWLAKYGDSVYGTRGGPWKPTRTYASTRKGNTVYLHLLNWDGRSVTLPNLPAKIMRSTVLTGGTAQLSQAGDSVTLRLDPPPRLPPPFGAELLLPQTNQRSNPAQIDTIVKLELERSAMQLPAL